MNDAILVISGGNQRAWLGQQLIHHGRDGAIKIARRQLYETAEFIAEMWGRRGAFDCLYSVADSIIKQLPPDYMPPEERDAKEAHERGDFDYFEEPEVTGDPMLRKIINWCAIVGGLIAAYGIGWANGAQF